MKVNLVKSNFINVQNQKAKNKQSNPKSLLMYKSQDRITFGDSFKTYEERMKDQRAKRNFWNRVVAWSWGASENADAAVKAEMENEGNILQRKIDVANTQLHEQAKYNDIIIDQQNTIIKTKNSENDALGRETQAHKKTIAVQESEIETKKQIIDQINNANEELKKHLTDKEKMIEDHKKAIDGLLKQQKQAAEESNTKLETALKQQLEELKKAHKIELDEIAKNIDKAGQTAGIFEQINNNSNIKGFGKMAGYSEQKDILKNVFGTPVGLERAGKPTDPPAGGILFFGPKGTGKTKFAEALAGQVDCELVRIKYNSKEKKNYKNIQRATEDAEKRFKKEGKRTIILINEFDIFVPKGSKISGAMKDLVENISKDYHATIFATTNNIDQIDEVLLRNKRFVIADLPPADKKNAADVLKHHAKTFVDDSVNYDELADHIVKVQPDEAYSNARIESLVISWAQKSENIGRKLTQNKLIQQIKDMGPDIDKAAYKVFKEHLAYAKRL